MTIHATDLAIIGSGSGNSLVTPFWNDKSVVIAEKGIFGGTCLNVGCIPTKMFVRSAMFARSPEEAQRINVDVEFHGADWPAIRDRVFGRIDPISEGGRRYRDEELDNVDLISQPVRLTAPKAFEAEDGTRVEAEHLVVAAGSRPAFPDIPGTELPGVHTSDTIMRLEELPERVVIIGGGFVACEFAHIFSGLGSEVIQVIRGDHLMRHMDDEIRDAYNALAPRYWRVQRQAEPEAIEQTADESLTVRTTAGSFEADAVLVATGRVPNTDLIGAREAGFDLHRDGRIVVDQYQRVLSGGAPLDGVYALGDICSAAQLKHVANYEARVVAHNLEHPQALRANENRPAPSAVFTHPEMAQVGLTEREARELLGDDRVTVKTQKYGDTAYGWALEDTESLFKLVGDRETGEVIGAHVIGYEASNLIQPIIMTMSLGLDAHTAARGQYWIHPALMEVTENALLGLDTPAARAAAAE